LWRPGDPPLLRRVEASMHLLNFSHPLTPVQTEALITLLEGRTFTSHICSAQFDAQAPFAEQAETLLNALPLSPAEWQSESLLLILPGHSAIAALILASIHGRCGYFPAFVRLRPVPDEIPPRFEIAEIVNLQAVRDRARTRRA
jgi:hypothetical protein